MGEHAVGVMGSGGVRVATGVGETGVAVFGSGTVNVCGWVAVVINIIVQSAPVVEGLSQYGRTKTLGWGARMLGSTTNGDSMFAN